MSGISHGKTAVNTRPTLAAWLKEYSSIRRDYVQSIAAQGIDFGCEGSGFEEAAAAKRRLRDAGAQFRNGGESISCGGAPSPACLACATGRGSKTFVLSLFCNRNCYFCFNAGQMPCDGGEACVGDWKREVDAFADECGCVTHVGLSGGEPLLHRDEALAFVRYVRKQHPRAHIRIYTAGDFLDDETLTDLRDAGLDELRMSIKLDVLDMPYAHDIIEEACAVLERAQRHIPAVMVEMPVIPGTEQAMRYLLTRLDRLGIFGINLLEFGYPATRWDEFRARGFLAKNPPYEIPYDYTYPCLPIEGSELACLGLLEFALKEGLSMSVHYCSLENKNRGQVYRQNMQGVPDRDVYGLDDRDYYYKTAKVFDCDVPIVRTRLERLGATYIEDGQEASLSFHPRWIDSLSDLPVVLATSSNVVERRADGVCMLRELWLDVDAATSCARE